MSPRLPPKISLKHEWTRELGLKVARQPEGEVARQTNFFQPAQPTPNPIRDRSGRPEDMQDGRNTSRSQEINVNSFDEQPSSWDRTGRLVETEVSQTRTSEDSKSLNVEQTHDRTVRPVAALHTAEAQDSSRVCSAHESDTLNVVDDENHEPMMVNEADGLQNTSTTTFRCETRAKYLRLTIDSENKEPPRSTCSSTRPTTRSMIKSFVPNQKQMIRDVGNYELCELLETEPKTQCKLCLSYWNIGILYCTCGHLLLKKRGGSAIHQLYDGPSVSSGIRHQERTTSWTSIWWKAGRQGIPHG